MAEVARLAGVSTATVSHVLNGTRPVRDHTRRQVLAAMDRVGYAPNAAARSLATARTRTLGLALSAISNPYLGELLHAVEAESAAAGYTLLLADPHDDPGYEATAVARLRSRVDGLLLAPSADSARTLEALSAQQVPTVLVDRLLGGTHDEVGTENVEPVAGLVAHLAGAGHSRIGFVAGHAGLATTVERLEGYRIGLRRAGLEYARVIEGHSEAEPARRAVSALLAEPDRPAALITGNNAMTIGAVQAAHDAGLRIPADVALAAFDDFPWADAFSPRLTVVAQPFAEIGREAVRMLLRRMEEPGAEPRSVRLKTRFVHRASCGCGGARHRNGVPDSVPPPPPTN
ncbi:LacI family DNA-binding transcriptional regulator [Pseudonocardia sp. C8]|uniref:LacI family DNA-binding transcriptional regulator n=1 Tax=Pseudonocardia sp. C8 TaxID=2762759 RepID=UPI00164250DE|nr:LacI family DNA-binding transcriptional regulator [Pseudonocardia sp. C8]MBC3191829.1 LacI family DNA-binding transcriptional regulator [Pseudonocardia sp. C8]